MYKKITNQDKDEIYLLTNIEDYYDLWRYEDPAYGSSEMPSSYPCLMTSTFYSNPYGADYYETRYIYLDQAWELIIANAYTKTSG